MRAKKFVIFAALILSFVAANNCFASSDIEQSCVACHGVNGQGRAALGYPRLAGDSKQYLEKQLDEFLDKQRHNSVMSQIVKQLTPKQIKTLANFFSRSSLSKRRPDTHRNLLRTPATQQQFEYGKEIVNHGLWAKAIPRCESCHGPDNGGFLNAPSLAGQSAKYLRSQLLAFKEGRRPGGIDDVMSHIAGNLTTQQINAVALYLSAEPIASAKIKYFAIAPTIPDVSKGFFQPPLEKQLPKGPFGQSIRFGYLVFTHTALFAPKFIGDDLSCTNCHVDGGRRPNSAPMWAAWGIYPKYRSKNHKINDIGTRIQGCFRYSENGAHSKAGHVPALNSKVIIALESYIKWLATDAPDGVTLKGQGYKNLPKPLLNPSIQRGKVDYANRCAACHGSDGGGHQNMFGQTVFPALWGDQSFNIGAGLHKVKTAAAFIKYNMPYGNPGTLTLQQAWDVAAYVDSHRRPLVPK